MVHEGALECDNTNKDRLKHVQQPLNHAIAVLSCNVLCLHSGFINQLWTEHDREARPEFDEAARYHFDSTHTTRDSFHSPLILNHVTPSLSLPGLVQGQ